MTTSVNAQQDIASIGGGQAVMGGQKVSLDEAMALLFMRRSEVMSGLATDRAQDAQDRLHDIQTARDMVARMKQLKKDAGSGTSEMPQDMIDYLHAHNIEYDHSGNDNEHKKDEWDVNIQYMQNYQDKLSSNNDLAMIKLKSVVNKANEGLQAADAMVTKNQHVVDGIIANWR